MTRPDERVALVTGASRGLGAAIALRLAAEGMRVILLARDEEKLAGVDDRIVAAGGAATLFPFDLAETAKIAAIGPAIAEKFGRLDVFVGNAAVLGAIGPVALSDQKTWQKMFKVNVHANAQLLRTLDPLLRGSAGRVIFTTCGMDGAHWGGYAASKAALRSIAESYAAEVAYSGVRVKCIDPGPLRTELRAEAFPGEDAEKLPDPAGAAGAFADFATETDAEAA